ncbi:hypothetical protein [Acidocella facilis]|uniref:hypothetical protein n=1 Tax=Acidocella facilis TaxID=525 RepID=UPI001F38954A|nr:hypothetical protein [Acidocella facilis]
MRKITATPISLVALTVLKVLLSSPAFANTQQNTSAPIAAYEQTLTAVSEKVMRYDFLSNFKKDLKQTHRHSICRPTSYCQSLRLQKTLLDLQQGRFTFIAPLALPQNGTDLLSIVKSRTACKNLAFMNITHDPFSNGRAPDNPLPEPLRPTEGIAVYRLPVANKEILLFRGENYQLAWPFWGADQNGSHLPSLDPTVLGGTVARGNDYMFEVDTTTCRVMNRFDYEGLFSKSNITKSGVTLTQKHFSEPIELNGNLFIINLDFFRLSNQGRDFQIELVKLSKNSGKIMEDFYFSTWFPG